MNQINFLPQAYIVEQARRRRVRREIALVAMVVLVMGGWFLIAQTRLEQLSLQTQAVERQAQVMRNQVKQALELQAQRTVLTRQFRIQRELAPALAYSQVLATIGALLPPSMAIRDLSMLGRQPTVDVPTGSKKAPRRQADAIRITLVGVAPGDSEVANFVGALADHPLFTNVKLLYSKSVEVGPLLAREYRIEIDVPLDRQFKPKTAGTEVRVQKSEIRNPKFDAGPESRARMPERSRPSSPTRMAGLAPRWDLQLGACFVFRTSDFELSPKGVAHAF